MVHSVRQQADSTKALFNVKNAKVQHVNVMSFTAVRKTAIFPAPGFKRLADCRQKYVYTCHKEPHCSSSTNMESTSVDAPK